MELNTYIEAQDFNKPSFLIALDLIYIANRYSVNPNKIRLGRPMCLDQRPDIEDDPNSFVPVEVNMDADLRFAAGNRGFMLRRLRLSEIEGYDSIVVSTSAPFKTADILDQLNTLLQTQLTMDDLQDITYEATNTAITLKANRYSWAWVGKIVIQVNDGNNPMLLFPISKLDGFKEYSSGAQ